jgi:Zn-dependent peptidase ImmA (M78 family)
VTTDTPAELILKALGITDPTEIDLEAIAWDQGARIRYRPLNQCEARIVGRDNRAVITVNSRTPRRRRRFSIAHELGHWHYHRGRSLMCAVDDIGRAAAGDLCPERVADRFASRLLMPDYLFQPIARSYSKIDFGTIREIADTFDTSATATAIRLVDGNYLSACLICHGPGGHKWFTRAPELPARWFPSRDLSADSFAFDMLFRDAEEQTFPRKIGADAWFDRRDADKYEVREQTIKIGDDEILSIILIDDEGMLRDW